MIREVVESLTVGQVSGLIALGTAIVAFTTPLLIAIFLLQYHNKETTAATWSVVARQLHLSAWPSFFRSDSVALKNVDKHVSAIRYLGFALALLTVIAGVVTPLGLHDQLTAVAERDAQFEYTRDTSIFGRSTQQRPSQRLSRDCGIKFQFCPGAAAPDAIRDQGNENASVVLGRSATTEIPSNITEFFTSLSKRSTIASIFDIQYRAWTTQTSDLFDGGSAYLAGLFRPIDNLIPRENVTLVEGAIADLVNGGIGYRNHSSPNVEGGTSWEEDILWVEPDFSCVNTNLSFEFELGNGNYSRQSLAKLELVDNGGFSQLSRGNPYHTWPNLTYTDPDTWSRANYTAWTSNVLMALALNLSDVSSFRYGLNISQGRRWTLETFNGTSSRVTDRFLPIGFKSDFIFRMEDVLSLPSITLDDDGNLVNLDTNETLTGDYEDHPREFGTFLLASRLDSRCSGKGNDVSENNDFNVQCGYVFTPASRIDGASSLLQDMGSAWKTDLYTCAGAAKASVKTVSFTSNGTASLGDIKVESMRDKEYAADSDFPVWAHEDWWYPGSEAAYGSPLWGLVDSSVQGTAGYNFSRAPHFYLPGNSKSIVWSPDQLQDDMLAGATHLWGMLSHVVKNAFNSLTTGVVSYTGTESLALATKWEDLSAQPDGISLILKLVWTDLITSMTIGTNSRNPGTPTIARRDTSPSSIGSISSMVKIYGRRITYNIKFAIPAIILLAFWALLIVLALVIVILHRSAPSHMSALLNTTSLGRIAAMIDRYPGDPDAQRAKTHSKYGTTDWLSSIGAVKLKFGGGTGSPNAPNAGFGKGGTAYEMIPQGNDGFVMENKSARAYVAPGETVYPPQNIPQGYHAR